jgi:hypothetical protein
MSSGRQQRFQGYKDQTETLNADQQKAVASIPILEATIKELQDVVKLLEVRRSVTTPRVVSTVLDRSTKRKLTSKRLRRLKMTRSASSPASIWPFTNPR